MRPVLGAAPSPYTGASDRSTMEGILFGLINRALLFQEMGISWEKVIASGGGARSPLLRQIQADLFNQPVTYAKKQEQPALGQLYAQWWGFTPTRIVQRRAKPLCAGKRLKRFRLQKMSRVPRTFKGFRGLISTQPDAF